MTRSEIGATGEQIAVTYLAQRGWRILARNVRYPDTEIDILAQDGDTLVIVEVRARRTDRFGTP
ncbi:MAG: YraN family protein, partial [Dehalococcoidia bacterium]|nr:YraN family protein [Dehalococcoidia bacterium]